MGGVPGGRITLLVVPIAVAHGLLVPKTSSRAITSAAGTADVMECVARVDLDAAELRRAVEAAGGAVAWSGRISHGPLDDVMNAINRPLGIRSASLDVASILSKKLVVGSTHVVVDVPFGPGTKTRTRAGGEALARLFETVGREVGLTVRAVVTDGARPIGRGVGPALELADVVAALTGAAHTPAALVEKAVDFAGAMIEWDPAVPRGTGRARARELLASGAAFAAFERMAHAQGRRPPVPPGAFARDVRAEASGVLTAFDGHALAGLARAAGAPADKGAGVAVRAAVGARVEAGEPLLTVVSGTAAGLARAGSPRAGEVATLA
jgi:thymidine phosphorylase